MTKKKLMGIWEQQLQDMSRLFTSRLFGAAAVLHGQGTAQQHLTIKSFTFV